MTGVGTGSVLIARDGGIATVTLNKPERLNALDRSMWERLAAIFRTLDADESLRCVILRGAGDEAFAAGADIAEFERERASTAA
jgi:enoyl-CoA hydratase/carnithine racemase